METLCSICREETDTFLCKGCSKEYCFRHLAEHKKSLNEQGAVIEKEYNQLKQAIADIKNNAGQHPMIKQVDQWEQDYNQKIKERADECRRRIIKYTTQLSEQIEMKIDENSQEFSSNGEQKRDFNEIRLARLRDKLDKLKEEFNQPENIFIEEISYPFVPEISVRLISERIRNFIPNLNIYQTWKQSATTIAGRNERGRDITQLAGPHGIFMDDDQTIYIADHMNHRIIERRKDSDNPKIIAGGRGRGERKDQLQYPTKAIVDEQNDCLIICDRNNRRVMKWPRQNGRAGEIVISDIFCPDLVMDNHGYLYLCDGEKHEVKRWKIGDKNGTIVAGGNGQGIRLDQLNNPRNIYVDDDHTVYVADKENHRVVKWVKDAKEGVVVAGGPGQGTGLGQLSFPGGIIIDESGILYVADFGNDRVMRWLKDAEEGTIVVGGMNKGDQANQLNGPIDLCFDHDNNLCVVDYGNHRVQRFDVDRDRNDQLSSGRFESET